MHHRGAWKHCIVTWSSVIVQALYDFGDRGIGDNIMLVIDLRYWSLFQRKESVTNIFNLSQTQTVCNIRHQYRCNLWVPRFLRYEISQPIENSVVWIMLSWKDWNNKIDFRNNDWNPPIIDRSSNQHSSCHIKWVSRNHEFVSMSFLSKTAHFAIQKWEFQEIFDEIAGKTFEIIWKSRVLIPN